MADGPSNKENKKTKPSELIGGLIVIAVVVALIIWGATALFGGSDNSNKAADVNSKQAASMQKAELPKDPIKRIETISKRQYGRFEVTLSTTDGKDFAKVGNGPWVVNLNSPFNAVGSCVEAKTIAFKTVKSLYTDSVASKNIAQVHISLSPQVQISLGANDAKQIDKTVWANSGPTTFAKSLSGSGSGPNDQLPAASQTYWQPISDKCQPD